MADTPDITGGTITREKTRVRPPPFYQVVLHNDDYTPMEFVVHLLERIFDMDRERATRIMLRIHTSGKGVCGVYTRDIAETKSRQANRKARDHGHPLLCEIEPCPEFGGEV